MFSPPAPTLTQLDRTTVVPRLVNVCRALLHDDVQARETAEDVWVDFQLIYGRQLKTMAAADAYLQLAAIRRCRRTLAVRARTTPLDSLTLEHPDDAASPESCLMRAQDERHRQEQVARCLEKLDPGARRLLRMRFHLEMTQEAIGEALGVSKQYAGRVLAKTLSLLRACALASPEVSA